MWRHYRSTILVFGGGGSEVDLRLALPPEMLGSLRAVLSAPEFAIITPFNPGGAILPEADNVMRLQGLGKEADVANTPHIEADGVSPDGTHGERGYAVAIPRDAALTLAIRYGQSAFFWFDGGAFWLVPACAPGQPQLRSGFDQGPESC